MVPLLCNNLKRLCLVLPLLALLLFLSPAMPLAEANIPVHTPRTAPTAIICLIGSFCVDVNININV
jgi:hypothetical protein